MSQCVYTKLPPVQETPCVHDLRSALPPIQALNQSQQALTVMTQLLKHLSLKGVT